MTLLFYVMGLTHMGGGPLLRHTLPTQKYAARINIWKLISWNVSCETFRKSGLYMKVYINALRYDLRGCAEVSDLHLGGTGCLHL